MQFHIGVGNQVAILLKVMRHADHVPVAFDHQRLVARLLEAHMEGVLLLEILQQVVGFQKMFDGGLKKGGHFGFLHTRIGGQPGRPPMKFVIRPSR